MSWLAKNRTYFLENWYSLDTRIYFVIICVLYFCSLLLKRLFVLDGIAAFEVLQSRGEMWVFDLFFGLQYFVVPVFLAWKLSLTAFILWVGCFLFGYRITYNQLWKLVLILELVFIVPELGKVLWFMLISMDPSYQDVVAFYPLSLINLVGYDQIPDSLHYPLKALNFFEIAYWWLLIAGIYWIGGKKVSISAWIVSVSYIIPFLSWLLYYIMVYR